MIEWFLILTTGCLPIAEQPEGANCVIETSIVEIVVVDKDFAESFAQNFSDELTQKLPGSFAIARLEKRLKQPDTT